MTGDQNEWLRNSLLINMTEQRTRGWCYTLNNWTVLEKAELLEVPCAYHVCGIETGESGTPHLQGFMYFKSVKSLRQVRAMSTRAHWKGMRGTVDQAADYCIKDGNFEERGERPLNQQKKGAKGAEKIKEMWDAAKAGNFEAIPLGLIRQAEYVHAKYAPRLADRTELNNLWIWGASGCGKSKYVRSEHPVFYSKGMSKWWDGYNREEVVLLDDFAPEHGKYLGYFLKIWADHYAFNAEVKGGMLNIRPDIVIVTSQYSIEDCFEDAQTIAAITRRFKVIKM